MISTLKTINNILSYKIKWVIFGGVAVAIHNGNLHREFEDIDIVVENDEKKLNQLIPSLRNCDRKGRKKRCIKINNVSVEFMLMSGQNEIDLADGKFQFQNIEIRGIDNLSLPVVDLQSLYCAKLRHKESLKNKSNTKKKLESCIKDIEVIQKILKINS